MVGDYLHHVQGANNADRIVNLIRPSITSAYTYCRQVLLPSAARRCGSGESHPAPPRVPGPVPHDRSRAHPRALCTVPCRHAEQNAARSLRRSTISRCTLLRYVCSTHSSSAIRRSALPRRARGAPPEGGGLGAWPPTPPMHTAEDKAKQLLRVCTTRSWRRSNM